MGTPNKNNPGLTDASLSSDTRSQATVNATVAGAGLVTSTDSVSGMTCGHRVTGVTEEFGGLDGVANVEVTPVVGGASQVTVSGGEALDPEAVAAAIDEAGLLPVPETLGAAHRSICSSAA
jgi:copper chaperone CopZ